MKLKHHDITIPKDKSDPFMNCKLDRKQYANVLTSIVESYADGFVLAINNKWGEGKTTFVKMWRQQMKNDEFNTLYFNAWENDFQEEVIIALLSELEELREKDKENFDTLLNKTATFLKKVAPAAVKGAVSKAIGEEAVGEIAAAAMEFTTEEVEQQIEYFNEKKKGITDFRETLEKFVKKVDNEKPIVFIIDELDRCRPNYAVKVLEQIKHLFSVPGIVFVLSIDKEQLGYAVRGVYGNDNIDSDEYLRRFIDLEYVIPKPELKQYTKYLYDYFKFDLFLNSETRKSRSSFQDDKYNFEKYNELFISNNMSLRQLEKSFSRIRLTLRSFRENQFVFPRIIVFLNFLKEYHEDIYRKIRSINYNCQELVNNIEPILIEAAGISNVTLIVRLQAMVVTFYFNDYRRKYNDARIDIVSYDAATGKDKTSLNTKLEDEFQSFSKMLNHYRSHYDMDNIRLSWIISKLDLTDNIVS